MTGGLVRREMFAACILKMGILSKKSSDDLPALQQEFQDLRRRARSHVDVHEELWLPMHVILTVVVTLIVGIHQWDLNAAALAFIIFILPGMIVSGFAAALISGPFKHDLEPFFTERRKKKRWYRRYLFLEQQIPLLLEAERERRLPVVPDQIN